MPDVDRTISGARTPTPTPNQAPRSAGPKTAAHRPALDQPFDIEGLFTLRSAVAAHAAELGAGTVLGDIVLVAHELSTNAVRHGGGTGRLQLWRSGEHLHCRVSDTGAGLADPSTAGTNRPSPSVPGGRGLWIARQMAEVEISTGGDGTTITAAFPLT